MKKSAIIVISMLFSVAVPTLAESAAGPSPNAQPAIHAIHGKSVFANHNNRNPAIDGTKAGAVDQNLTANEEE